MVTFSFPAFLDPEIFILTFYFPLIFFLSLLLFQLTCLRPAAWLRILYRSVCNSHFSRNPALLGQRWRCGLWRV